MTRRLLTVLAIVLVGLGFAVAPAHAGVEEYPPDPGITVDDPNVDPGGTVTVRGESCAPGVLVTIEFLGEVVATVTTAEDGTFVATFDVPAGTAAGTYDVDAIDCTTEVLSTSISVGAPATTTTTVASTTLPRTGSDGTETLVRVGVVLLAAGGLLAFAARRRSVATR
jgi:LPXTG-motif cell wall-anchored protein